MAATAAAAAAAAAATAASAAWLAQCSMLRGCFSISLAEAAARGPKQFQGIPVAGK